MDVVERNKSCPLFRNPGRLQGGAPKKPLLNLGWIRNNPQKVGFQNNISYSFIRQFIGGYIRSDPIEITGSAGCPPCTQCWPQKLTRLSCIPITWRANIYKSLLEWGWTSPPVVGLDIPNFGIKECGAKGKVRQVPISTCFWRYLLYMEYDLCIYMEILHLDFFIYCVTCVYMYIYIYVNIFTLYMNRYLFGLFISTNLLFGYIPYQVGC